MQSFRTEIENPVVERDIIELERKIQRFKEGSINEERFRSLRLARGVYGQRQPGVQMIRIKLPYGKVTPRQLRGICDVSDEYSTGRLHITTRQDIQIHHVSLDRTPELWARLERDEVTLREACGNTVRNVTASPMSGVDPQEAFDVTPHADALFRYFLRNPVCQEMGRKIKISFSSSEADTALAYMHDLGFLAAMSEDQKGFKVFLGGGLGSQPRHADLIYEFLPEDEVIPFTEAVLRTFDRFGERQRRMKARLKFLLKEKGLEHFMSEVAKEQAILEQSVVPIPSLDFKASSPLICPEIPADVKAFDFWERTNVLPQKQGGLFSIGVRVVLGDFYTKQARVLADLIEKYSGGEIRMTLRQNFIIRDVPEANLPFFHARLVELGLGDPGFESAGDITACPGTDTCNLGIASSTGIALELERVLLEEYPAYLDRRDITIKISGCMNACGQHMMAHIGFQGMSIKHDGQVLPALQILLGGGTLNGGNGRFADKVIKVPSRRGPEALRLILDCFESEHRDREDFLSFYDRLGKNHFYELLKPLGSPEKISVHDLVDWGHENTYVKAVGVGECAGVVIDLVGTLLVESEEKLDEAARAFGEERWADGIYLVFTSIVNTAKALLTSHDVQGNSHAAILRLFDEHFTENKLHPGKESFEQWANQVRTVKPGSFFGQVYLAQARNFLKAAENLYQSKAS